MLKCLSKICFPFFLWVLREKPDVLYPTVKLSSPDAANSVSLIQTPHPTFVSINRFERKKNVDLALKSLFYVKKQKHNCQIILAGG